MIKKNIKGFTLIELLVVVLIIGILSSVALPQYRRSVEKAKFAEAAELMQAISNAEQRYSLENGEYAEFFEDLDIVIPNKSAIKMEKKTMLLTDNFRIYLSSVNDDALISAERIIPGNGSDARYTLYRHVVTGELFCEDMDEKDSIDCTLFAVTGNAVSCDDGTVSLTGAGGCPEEKEEVKPINKEEKETFKPKPVQKEEAAESEVPQAEAEKKDAPKKALNP